MNRAWMNAAPLILLIFIGTTACATRKIARSTLPPNVLVNDSSYVDLEAGQTLRVVVPLLRSGGFVPAFSTQGIHGSTISLAAADVIGFRTYFYAARGKMGGKVRLQLVATEDTRDGRTAPRANPPRLPFGLPRGRCHVRLLHLVQMSRADHNMAVLAAARLDALNALTQRVMESPARCVTTQDAFCSWVPAGIGVRTEAR